MADEEPGDLTETGAVYLGDGLYAELNDARQIVLHTTRYDDHRVDVHWVALEPEVFLELLQFARSIGWGDLFIKDEALQMSDAEYARAEEDAERKRDAADDIE